MSTEHRDPFSLTYVTYDSNDPLGNCMALLTLTPIFIVVALTALVVCGVLFDHRSSATAQASVFLLGQLLNDGMSRMIKIMVSSVDALNFISERPYSSDRKEGGMPSNHAQSVGFFASYAVLLLCLECSVNVSPQNCRIRPILIVSFAFLAVLVSYSRVHLGYHTALQVSVGLTLGAAVALVFFLSGRSRCIKTIRAGVLGLIPSDRPLLLFNGPSRVLKTNQ